jgi:NADP-dependent 3-hydroxy acid dehydrogenase YdfG
VNYKCAFITGASSGIGAATAQILAERGLSLILAARRMERLESLKLKLESQFKVQVETVALDVRQPQQILEFSERNREWLSRVDVLINNAGLAKGSDKFAEANPSDWDAMLDTNVRGLLYVTRVLLPHLIKQPKSHVVNLGSVAGRWVYPGGAVYCASKFAVRALSEGMRMDLQGTSVRISNIEPGMVETEFSEVRFHGDREKAKSVYSGMTPLSARDIAECVAWCLDRPAHVNIQELVVFPSDQSAIQQVQRRKT